MARWCDYTDVQAIFKEVADDSDWDEDRINIYIDKAMRSLRSWLGGTGWGFTRAQIQSWDTTTPGRILDLTAHLAMTLIQLFLLGMAIPNPENKKEAAQSGAALNYLTIYEHCQRLARNRETLDDDDYNIIAPEDQITINKTEDDAVFIGNEEFY